MQTYHFDFLKYRYISFILALGLLAGTVGVYWHNLQTKGYGFKLSVDFTGGTEIVFNFDKPINTEQLKTILRQGGWQGAVTREFSPTEILVRVNEFKSDAQGEAERLRAAIDDGFPGTTVTIARKDSIGPGAGAQLRSKAFYAIGLALLLMLAYIALRFQFAFAIGAVVALFHDALVILAFFLFTDKEISTYVIMAILMILGYSINDTIVIFSKIRENLARMQGASITQVVNASINQTMTRTIRTSVSTALTAGSLYFLGGETLHDLSLALLLGIVFGTYSSVFIASPVMMLLYNGRDKVRA